MKPFEIIRIPFESQYRYALIDNCTNHWYDVYETRSEAKKDRTYLNRFCQGITQLTDMSMESVLNELATESPSAK